MGESYDLTIVGGGTAGLTVASGAVRFGARVALIERDRMGGDCLNWGCVPTKALIRSSRIAASLRHASDYGIVSNGYEVNFPAVMNRVRKTVEMLAAADSIERFQGLGVETILGNPEFQSAHEIRIGDRRITSSKVVIATGSRAAVPPIPGLRETGFITNVEALKLQKLPRNLVILGAGPIGLEFAQAFARLGSHVTVIEMFPQILPREDGEVAEVVKSVLSGEGIQFLLDSKVVQVTDGQPGKMIVIEQYGQKMTVSCDEVFVATGRLPNREITGLENVGVASTRTGIRVDRFLRTTVPHIYAAGDVNGGLQFTHVAGYEGRVVVRNTQFPLRQRTNYRVVPWTIYTDPEVAHVGLTEHEAKEHDASVHVYTGNFQDVDRSVIDGETDGFVKVIVDKKGQIVGGHVVGAHAGELIQELVFAMHHHIPLGRISQVIHAYPSRVEGIRNVADLYWRQKLFDGNTAQWLKRFSRWSR